MYCKEEIYLLDNLLIKNAELYIKLYTLKELKKKEFQKQINKEIPWDLVMGLNETIKMQVESILIYA